MPFIRTDQRDRQDRPRQQRIEVHARQREFLGPFEVDSQGRALFLTVGVDGAEGIDVMVVPKDAGEQWLSLYIHQPMTTPPAYPPLLADVALSGQPYRKMLPVAKGRYYLVIDNTATAGRIAPPPNLFDDRAALVNYAVERGTRLETTRAAASRRVLFLALVLSVTRWLSVRRRTINSSPWLRWKIFAMFARGVSAKRDDPSGVPAASRRRHTRHRDFFPRGANR